MSVICNYKNDSISINVQCKAFLSKQLYSDAKFQLHIKVIASIAAATLFAGGIAGAVLVGAMLPYGSLFTALLVLTVCSATFGYIFGAFMIMSPGGVDDLIAHCTSLPVCHSLERSLNSRSVLNLSKRAEEQSWKYLKHYHELYQNTLLQIMESQLLNESRMEELRTAISLLGLKKQ